MAQLTIAIDDAGHVSVNGPIDNIAFCYGIIEVAKDVIRKHNESKRIQPAKPGELVEFGAPRL